MAGRFARILAVVLLSSLIIAAVAHGDGDPASDTLLGESVFYPYTPAVSGSVQGTLNSETAAAKRAGFPIKVALIASPIDLGVIPNLFGHPQQYADFLDQEISFLGKQPLLVVMSDGYGAQGFGGPARLAVRALRPPAGRTSTDLAQAAIGAVAKLAAAAGHSLKGVRGLPDSTAAGDSSSSSTALLIGLVVAAVAVAAAVLVFRRRQAIRPAR